MLFQRGSERENPGIEQISRDCQQRDLVEVTFVQCITHFQVKLNLRVGRIGFNLRNRLRLGTRLTSNFGKCICMLFPRSLICC